MNKFDFVIAIDPDITRSGVAFLDVANRKLELSSLTFPNLMDYLIFIKGRMATMKDIRLLVIVEAGWQNKGNWHLFRSDNKAQASAKGRQIGRNHECGMKIVEMARHYGFEVLEQPPLRKGWKGKDGKITQEEFAYFTGVTTRTSQDMRDAGLIAWNYANLPIRVKV